MSDFPDAGLLEPNLSDIAELNWVRDPMATMTSSTEKNIAAHARKAS